mgnify:FL=1
MAIQAQLADGRILEFPDGTDPNVIQATVKKIINKNNSSVGVIDNVSKTTSIQKPEEDQLLNNFLSNPENFKRTNDEGDGTLSGSGRALLADLENRILSGDLKDEPQPQSIVDRTLGALQLGGTVASSILAEPVSGLGGIVAASVPGLEKGSGAKVVEGVQEAMTFKPGKEGEELIKSGINFFSGFGEYVPEVVKKLGKAAIQKYKDAEQFSLDNYGPGATTIFATAPTALMEAIPGLAIIKKARNVAADVADEIIEETVVKLKKEGVETLKSGTPSEAKTYQEITEDLRTQNTKEVKVEIDPDPEILAAALALGIDLNPSHYSNNYEYMQVEQALKSRPGSKLGKKEQIAITDTGAAADNFIKDLDGKVDKSLLDANIRDDFEIRLNDLDTKADNAYNAVNDAIPNAAQVNPEASRSFINRQLGDLGGDQTLLTAAEKKLLRISDSDTHMTYAAIDRIRKDIGNAIGKRSGPFKDDDIGQLKQLYKVLSEDQQGVADAFGIGAGYALARKLVKTRKDLEKQAVVIFGKDMNKSIIPLIKSSAAGLTKGDVSTFNKLMDAVPKNKRQEVAATMLNDIFTEGARTKGDLSSGFLKSFAGLNRNAGAKKRLFEEFPEGAEQRFNDIGIVATGIFRSKSLENTSKTATAILTAMDEAGFFGKLYGKAVDLTPNVPAKQAIVSIVNKVQTPATEAADDLLTSPAFKNSVEAAARGSLDESQKITKTQVFKRWLATQPTDIKKEVLAIGFIPFLTDIENNIEAIETVSNFGILGEDEDPELLRKEAEMSRALQVEFEKQSNSLNN